MVIVLGVILLASLYVPGAILLVVAFGVFYAVSILFNLSRRLRLSLVIIAAVLTTAHQLLVDWYFELPTAVYYITAFSPISFFIFCLWLWL